MRRLLAIDGGGLKGALPAALLAEVEERSGKRIIDQFDLIAREEAHAYVAVYAPPASGALQEAPVQGALHGASAGRAPFGDPLWARQCQAERCVARYAMKRVSANPPCSSIH